MTHPESDPFAHTVHATEWAIILSDWKRSNAWVTIHLRGGQHLGPGKVTRLPGPALDSVELTDPQRVTDRGRRETRWTFNLGDVAAITAEASR